MVFEVFVRDWWMKDEGGRVVPFVGAPKELLGEVESEQEARDMCREYNATHEPGWESRKAEYREM